MTIAQAFFRLMDAAGSLVDRVTALITWVDGVVATIQKMTRDMLTEDDGRSFCGWRFGMFVGVATVTALTIYQAGWVVHAVTGEMLESYAKSLGIIIGSGGAGLAAKQWSQGGVVPPGPEDKP